LGRIFDELPHVHVHAIVDAVLFRPTLGTVLVGKVYVIGAGHIALLIAGVFNATIYASALTPWYSFDADETAWTATAEFDDACTPNIVSKNARTLADGCDVSFYVKAITFSAGIVSLEGSFSEVLTND
jgi:hypothetical protein